MPYRMINKNQFISIFYFFMESIYNFNEEGVKVAIDNGILSMIDKERDAWVFCKALDNKMQGYLNTSHVKTSPIFKFITKDCNEEEIKKIFKIVDYLRCSSGIIDCDISDSYVWD